MMCGLVVRRLTPDSYDAFRRAWEPESDDEWPRGMTRLWIGRADEDPDVVATWGLFELDAAGLDELRDDPDLDGRRGPAPAANGRLPGGADRLELLRGGRGGPSPPGDRGVLRRQPDHREDASDEERRHGVQRDDPVGPVPLPDAVVEPEDRAREQPRVVAAGSRPAASRWTGSWPTRSRVAVPAPAPPAGPAPLAATSAGSPSSPCSATSSRLRWMSSSRELEAVLQHGDERPRRVRVRVAGGDAPRTAERKSSIASSMITYRQCCLDSK